MRAPGILLLILSLISANLAAASHVCVHTQWDTESTTATFALEAVPTTDEAPGSDARSICDFCLFAASPAAALLTEVHAMSQGASNRVLHRIRTLSTAPRYYRLNEPPR